MKKLAPYLVAGLVPVTIRVNNKQDLEERKRLQTLGVNPDNAITSRKLKTVINADHIQMPINNRDTELEENCIILYMVDGDSIMAYEDDLDFFIEKWMAARMRSPL